MEVIRLLPSTEADDLLALTREIATDELAPRVALAEEEARFPREELRTLGRAGLLSLPFDEEMGGGGQPYEVYLQVLEELSRAWLAVGISVSVHALACFPMATAGTAEQQEEWLPQMLSGDTLGAYCLSSTAARPGSPTVELPTSTA
jgi:alkylation response protein AidB-like acyl-CoA dehydrogenase